MISVELFKNLFLITQQLNWCYSKKKVCSFWCRKPDLTISLSWKVMSIWIQEKWSKISIKPNFSSFLRIQMLMIFHLSDIERWGLRHWKGQSFILSVTWIQLTCHENKFLNNSTKIMKIEGFIALFLHYFINCSFPWAASTKTNYLIAM